MSNHERVWGTLNFPAEKYNEIKDILFQLQKKEDEKLLVLAEKAYLKLKEPKEYQKFKQLLGDSKGYQRNHLIVTFVSQIVSSQNPGLIFYEQKKIQDFILNISLDGRLRIRNPKIIKLEQNSNDLQIGNEGKLTFNDERKTISVSIGENNHSYTYAKNNHIYKAFENILNSITLEQGFGGQLLYEGSYSKSPEVIKSWGPPPLTIKKQFRNSPY